MRKYVKSESVHTFMYREKERERENERIERERGEKEGERKRERERERERVRTRSILSDFCILRVLRMRGSSPSFLSRLYILMEVSSMSSLSLPIATRMLRVC